MGEYWDDDYLNKKDDSIVNDLMAITLHQRKLKYFDYCWYANNTEVTRPFLIWRIFVATFISLPFFIFLTGKLSLILNHQGNDFLFILQFPVELLFIYMSIIWLILFFRFIVIIFSRAAYDTAADTLKFLILYRFIWLWSLKRIDRKIKKRKEK